MDPDPDIAMDLDDDDPLDTIFQDASESCQAASAAAASATSTSSTAFPAQTLPARGRGRPAGTFGGAVVRKALQEQCSEQTGDQAPAPEPGSIEYARMVLQKRVKKRKAEQAALSAQTGGSQLRISRVEHEALSEYGDFLSTRTTGSQLQANLFQAVAAGATVRTDADDDAVDNMIKGSMHTMSFKALSAITNKYHMSRRMMTIARAVLEACCYLWALFFALAMNLCRAVDGCSRFKPLLCCTVLRYDETPTKVRIEESNEEGHVPISTSATHAKILQVEHSVGVLLVDSSNGKYTFVKGQVPSCLFALKSTDGKTTCKALLRVLNSTGEGLTKISQECKFQIRHSCTDQAKSNYAAERLVTAQFPDWVSLHTAWDVHRLYRCTRTAMCGLDFDVSGMLSFALALGAPGSAATLRNKLGQIIARRLDASQNLVCVFILCCVLVVSVVEVIHTHDSDLNLNRLNHFTTHLNRIESQSENHFTSCNRFYLLQLQLFRLRWFRGKQFYHQVRSDT